MSERPDLYGSRVAESGKSNKADNWAQKNADTYTTVETLGWSDCGHDSWRRGCVLDPFAGSGTTLAVATGHNRDAIGIDLDQRNADLCRERIGFFLSEIVLPLKDVPPRIVDVEGSTMEEMFG